MDYLQRYFKDDNVSITCIYCNYREQPDQTVSNLVASLLKQLVQDHSAIYDNVGHLYECHRRIRTKPTLDEIHEVLCSETAKFSKAFIVVDALDECSEVNQTRAGLLKALRSLGSNVSLLVTSRDLTELALHFCDTKRLDIRATNEDVQRYIEDRISRGGRLAIHVKQSRTLQAEIVGKIIEQVDGM